MKNIFLTALLLIFFVASACNGMGERPSSRVDAEHVATEVSSQSSSSSRPLKISSFNIQFLGNSNSRDDVALAKILKKYDIVVVQELVSPPYSGTFANGDPFKPDTQSSEFFDEMKNNGFSYVLSEEDTGTGDTIHKNGSATEWWVTFYKPGKVKSVTDIPHGFLAEDRSNHTDYERVPYGFAFRSADGKSDFVLISVHLKPGKGSKDKKRRKEEFAAITKWVNEHDDKEKDFIILGDMNIGNCAELKDVTPIGYLSLNDECVPTHTNLNSPKPYDHIMYNTTHTKNEIDTNFDFKVVNLIDAMKTYWSASSTNPYPGDPYNHNEFRKYYSDHHPVEFRIKVTNDDD